MSEKINARPRVGHSIANCTQCDIKYKHQAQTANPWRLPKTIGNEREIHTKGSLVRVQRAHVQQQVRLLRGAVRALVALERRRLLGCAGVFRTRVRDERVRPLGGERAVLARVRTRLAVHALVQRQIAAVGETRVALGARERTILKAGTGAGLDLGNASDGDHRSRSRGRGAIGGRRAGARARL